MRRSIWNICKRTGTTGDQTNPEYTILLVFVLAAGTLFAMAITNSITGPLERLLQTAERLEREIWMQRRDFDNLEEINILARTFNHMSERIRKLLEKNTQNRKT